MRDYKNYYNGEFSNYDGASVEDIIAEQEGENIAVIDDNNISTETTYSSSKIETLVSGVTIGIPIIDKTSDTGDNFNIEPNKMYMLGERETLTINFIEGENNVLNEYMFQFTSGNVATTLNVPNTVVWLKEPDIQTNKIYQVSIENNLGIIGEWSNE